MVDAAHRLCRTSSSASMSPASLLRRCADHLPTSGAFLPGWELKSPQMVICSCILALTEIDSVRHAHLACAAPVSIGSEARRWT